MYTVVVTKNATKTQELYPHEIYLTKYAHTLDAEFKYPSPLRVSIKPINKALMAFVNLVSVTNFKF